MSIFGQKVSLLELLRKIPDIEINQLAKAINVDYYTKELDGKLMFYLLLYALLRVDRLGQRGLADVFSSPIFRFLFNYQDKKEKISHSSLSEQLSVIKISFFSNAYECIYQRFSSLYTQKEIAGLCQRVDSTLVKDCSGRLQQGLTCGNEHKKKKNKEDSKIQLYRIVKATGKKGQSVSRQVLDEEEFRLIRFRPAGKNEDILLITNVEELPADEIASIYLRR